jgi:hypothetical protein
MAFTNNTTHVKGPLIQAIALAAPAAGFTDGVEIGMKKPSKLSVTPNVTEMSSKNAWVDSLKVSLTAAMLQNDFATLDMLNTYAEGYAQAYLQTAGGAWAGFLGADSDSETLMGLDYSWNFKGNEDEFQITLMTEVAKATYDTMWVEVAPSDTWSAGVDTTLRNRPGVKKVTFGGAPLGALISCEGSVKNVPVNVQLGRPLSTGLEAEVKIVLAQTSKAEITAALAAAAGSDTVIVTFWDGVRSLKLTNLLAGKACTFDFGEKDQISITVKAFFPKGSDRVKINTVAGVLELVFLDNTAL